MSIDKQFNAELLNINSKDNYVKSVNELKKIEEQLSKNKTHQKEWNSKVDELNLKLAKSQGLDDVNEKMNNIGNSINSTIKKVGKWALAVFGVRSAYSAVRSAASTLSQYNKQIGADLEYIKYMLASQFQGIIQGIIGLVYKLMAYVKYLAKAWFNIDLFTKKQSDGFKKSNKEAKKLSKTLAAFDEINTLDKSDSSNTGDTSGVSTPSVNLDKIKIPSWLVKLKDFFQPVIDVLKKIYDKKGVIGIIEAIALAFVGWKIIKTVAKWITGLGKSTKGISADFTGLLDGLGKAAEAFAILGGLSLVIESVCNLIDSFSESGMSLGEVAGLLGIVLGELVLAFGLLLGAMTLLEPSWQSIAAAAVIFAGFALVIESVTHLIDVFANSGLSLNDVIGLMATILITIIALMGSIVLLGPGLAAGLVPFLGVVTGISAILIVMAATLPIILEAVANFIQNTAPSLTMILQAIGELIEKIILALGDTLPPIIHEIGRLFNTIFNGISKVIQTVGNIMIKILESIGKLIDTVLKSILNFINELGPAINNFVDGAIQAVTKLINFLISGVEYMINTLIIDAINGLISAVNNIPLVDIPEIPRVTIARFKPTYMATGGIIDVPKRGVPLTSNVIGGEAGAEGVLPLTDEVTMQRLGQEIGKWITMNVNFNGSLSQLARILKPEIDKEQNRVGTSLIGGN